MVTTYCNYGLYNEDTCESLEEGDPVSEFSYWNDGHKITLEDVMIEDIRKDEVTLKTDDWDEIIINVGDIEGWS
jgi:hypothetical protein